MSSKVFLQSSGFLEAKTNVPVLRKSFVKRPRLTDVLNNSDRRFFIINAPAGYGKTSLVAEHIKENKVKTAWLSIDSSDNNLNGFYRNLCFSISKCEKDLFSDLLDIWNLEAKVSIGPMLDVLIDKLYVVKNGFTIVLDDFHYINNEKIYNLIEQLINWVPENIRIIILSRRRLNFRNIPKLRLKEQIDFIDANDLRFSLEEARNLFSLGGINGLTKNEEVILIERSEGWVAGLQFATISKSSSKSMSQLINDFGESNQNIKDYFFLEVFGKLDDDLKSFMIKTSFLEMFCSDLCDEILCINNSSEIIERLFKNNLFLIEVKSDCYRYHNLMRQMLLDGFRSSLNVELTKLQTNAAKWFIDNKHYEEALMMYKSMNDYNSIIDILNQRSSKLIYKSELVKLCYWVELVPIELVLKNPLLTLDYMWALLLTGELGTLEKVYKRVEANSSAFVNWELLSFRAVRNHFLNNIKDSILLSNEALSYLPDENRAHAIKSVVLFHLGKSYMLFGRHHEAIDTFTKCIDNSTKYSFWTTLLMSHSHIGMTNILQGRFSKAKLTFSHVIKEKDNFSEIDFSTYCFAYLGLGIVSVEDNKIELALNYLLECVRLNNILGNQEIHVTAHFQLSRIYLIKGEYSKYEISSGKIYDVGLQTQQERVKGLAKLYIALLEIGTGHHVLLDEIVDDLKEFSLNDESVLYNMKEHALIRYYISINDITNAKKILTSFMKHLDLKEQALYHLSSLLLFCNILVIEEDIDEALVFLRKAINIGSSDLFLRSFLDEERSLSSLIYELRKKDDLSEPEKEFLELIISNFVVSIENKYLETKLIDPLSRREMDVIELIAKGLQNKEIGNQLFISTGTVKTHIVKIYSKLDVRNRTEAINKAKELEIII